MSKGESGNFDISYMGMGNGSQKFAPHCFCVVGNVLLAVAMIRLLEKSIQTYLKAPQMTLWDNDLWTFESVPPHLRHQKLWVPSFAR